jgi:hypothetical protein
MVIVNAMADGLCFSQVPTFEDTGACNFLQLWDTPSTYSGQAEKMVIVSALEDGLCFAQVTTHWVSAPSAAGDPGNAGDMAFMEADGLSYFCICVAASTWLRTEINSW